MMSPIGSISKVPIILGRGGPLPDGLDIEACLIISHCTIRVQVEGQSLQFLE